MQIDNNKLEIEALRTIFAGKSEEGEAMQRQFLDEIIASGEDHCPCQTPCPHHGNCFECVQIHRGHGDHLPVCFWNMINARIEKFSRLTEGSFRSYTPCEGCDGSCPAQD